MEEKLMIPNNQQTFHNCNMRNNKIKVTVYCIITRKETAKGTKNLIDAVDGKGIGNNYDRQIQGQSNFRNTFVILK